VNLYCGNEMLIVLGVLLESALLILLKVTGLNRGSSLLEIFFWLPFTIYLLTIWWISKRKEKFSGKIPAIIIFFALLFQVTLLPSPLPLSNDIYRYYWDGKVINHGFNPYAYTPDAEELRPLRDSYWQKVNNKPVQTMYPPLSQAVFSAAYFIFPGLFTLRLFSVLFHLLSVWVIILILKKFGMDIRYSIIYAWSPLAALEFANSGHIDSLAILLTLVSFLLLMNKRSWISSAVLALAVLSKIFPLLFAGLFFPRWGKKGTFIFAIMIIAAYSPFLRGGVKLFEGFSFFVQMGSFNGSLFPLLLAGLGRWMGEGKSLMISQTMVLLAFICLLIYLFWRLRPYKEDNLLLWRYSFWLTGTFLLLSPTMHPWYLTWVLPFLCFFRSKGWILLTGTAILARSVYIGYDLKGIWEEIWWVKLCEYVPPYLFLFYEWFGRVQKGEKKNSGI
jgi:alpha-1,6-mannosyltransferase